MSLKTRKTTIFAALEAVYGTAEALDGNDAIRTHAATISPLEGSTVKRDLDGQGFGNDGEIHVGVHVKVEFDVEMAGSGAAGTAPAYGRLFKACQMAETIDTGVSVTYAPASNGTDSLTMYFQLDGQRHALRGARGTWSIKGDSQGIPYFHFVFTGLWVNPATATDLVPDFTGFLAPKPITYEHTPTVTLHALASVFIGFTYDHANQVEHFDNPGEEAVEITDRMPAGTINLLAPVLSTKNYFTAAKADTVGNLLFTHGVVAGNIIKLAAPRVQLLQPKYGDDRGRAMVTANTSFVRDVNDDEMELEFT